MAKGKKINVRDIKTKLGKREKYIIAALAVVLILAVGIAIGNNSETILSSVEYGSIDNIPEGVDLQEYVNQRVEEGMFQVFINTNIIVDKRGNANLLIQNSKENKYKSNIEIYEGEKLIYTSKTIKPGYKIEKDKVKGLSEGEHQCIAYFNIYSSNGDSINRIGVNVKLTQES